MRKTTKQMLIWSGEFGRDYTDRNALSVEEMDMGYQEMFGISRTDLNRRFLGGLHSGAQILEVGCNIGNQLVCLLRAGFRCLQGIELQEYAIGLAKLRAGINIIQGSAFEIPFKARSFDLVFTSGVLIHVHPNDLTAVMKEIHRCSRKYIWGFEYCASDITDVHYRGRDNLLWKADYARLYQQTFADLVLEKEERLKYLNSGNVDSMFLLAKRVGVA